MGKQTDLIPLGFSKFTCKSGLKILNYRLNAMVLNGIKQKAVPSGVPRVSALGLVIIIYQNDLPD